jgi:hypothetical protein
MTAARSLECQALAAVRDRPACSNYFYLWSDVMHHRPPLTTLLETAIAKKPALAFYSGY